MDVGFRCELQLCAASLHSAYYLAVRPVWNIGIYKHVTSQPHPFQISPCAATVTCLFVIHSQKACKGGGVGVERPRGSGKLKEIVHVPQKIKAVEISSNSAKKSELRLCVNRYVNVCVCACSKHSIYTHTWLEFCNSRYHKFALSLYTVFTCLALTLHTVVVTFLSLSLYNVVVFYSVVPTPADFCLSSPPPQFPTRRKFSLGKLLTNCAI